MNIGFVTAWHERGAAYVTKAYIDLIKDTNNIFVYARGDSGRYVDNNWNQSFVTRGKNLSNTKIEWRKFKAWLQNNNLETIIFNEQRDFRVIYLLKREFPHIRVGAYIDYYTSETVENFSFYDFILCNTKRHYSVFKWHPSCYFLPWGVDIDLFSGSHAISDEIVFFHSAGMSRRKGTDVVIDVFFNSNLHTMAKLIIHTQIPISNFTNYSIQELRACNIEVIEKTVTAPGLYHLGDVYVYPTTLEGLGLTLYEALSSSMPVITTDCPPMNEIIDGKSNGKLVKVEKYTTRSDAYYWPLAWVDKDSLYQSMLYYIENKNTLTETKEKCRKYAIENLSWSDRKESFSNIINSVVALPHTKEECNIQLRKDSRKKMIKLFQDILSVSTSNVDAVFSYFVERYRK